MQFHIQHITDYRYSKPVTLGSHVLRFYPRCDGTQNILHFEMSIDPLPVLKTEYMDLNGNRMIRLWFEGQTDRLHIDANMQVETHRLNPFDYIPEPGTEYLPMTYGMDIENQLIPFRLQHNPTSEVIKYVRPIVESTAWRTIPFLNALNRNMNLTFKRIIRETGEPYTPEETLAHRQGSCRDLTLLFMECCKVVGLAARFVSGYQKGVPGEHKRYLHAWPEVFIPGGGWRGYDPAYGLAVADQHVAIAASAEANHANPIEGSYGETEETSSTIQTSINIKTDQEYECDQPMVQQA